MQFLITVTCINRRSCFIFHKMALGYPKLPFWRGDSSQNTEHVLSILWSEGTFTQVKYVIEILEVQEKANSVDFPSQGTKVCGETAGEVKGYFGIFG